MNITREWDLDRVVEYLKQCANSYIAGRECTFNISTHRDDTFSEAETEIRMVMNTAHLSQRRVVAYKEGDNILETLDLANVQLTHMAVNAGLIQTTPKNITHTLTVIGDSWETTEVQLDGHTMRSCFSLDIDFKAGETPKVAIGLSPAQVHLDQAFLPKDMRIELEGMQIVTQLLREVANKREEGFKDKDTGEEFALLHSKKDEVSLYRKVYEALSLYEAVVEDPEGIVEVGGSAKVH